MRCVVEKYNKDRTIYTKIVFKTEKIVYIKKRDVHHNRIDDEFDIFIGFENGLCETLCYEDVAERDAEYERVLSCWNTGDRKTRVKGHLTV